VADESDRVSSGSNVRKSKEDIHHEEQVKSAVNAD
jgi:hypothetical protein